MYAYTYVYIYLHMPISSSCFLRVCILDVPPLLPSISFICFLLDVSFSFPCAVSLRLAQLQWQRPGRV